MPITFHPSPGTVLICDFATGFQPPEMVKRRHCSGLCPGVSLGIAEPNPVEAFHHMIPVSRYSFFRPDIDVRAKADMLPNGVPSVPGSVTSARMFAISSREEISCALRSNRLLTRAARHALLTEPGPEGTPLGSVHR